MAAIDDANEKRGSVEEARLGRDDARIGRPIQRQAAGFIARAQTEARDRVSLDDDRIGRSRVRGRRARRACWDRASAAPPIRPSARSRRCRSARSFAAAETSFLNAPTLTSTKLAKAISARLNTDRAGRTDVCRMPSANIAGRPRPSVLDDRRRRRQDRRRAESADQPRAAGAEESGGRIDRAGRSRRPAGRRRAISSATAATCVDVVDARRVAVAGVAFEQRARRSPAHRAHAEPEREQARRASAPATPMASHSGATCSVEIGRADGADPPRAQAVEDQRAVADRRRSRRSTAPIAARIAPSRMKTRADRRRRRSPSRRARRLRCVRCSRPTAKNR